MADATSILEAIAERSGTIVYVKDLEGRYTFVNPAWEAVTGIARAQAIGRSDMDMFGAAMSEVVAILMENDRRAREGLVRIEERFDQDDGPHFFESLKFPVTDGEGRVVATCGLSVDVTAEHTRRAALDEAQRIARIGSWTWDPARDAATWSPEMYRIFARDPRLGPAVAGEFFAAVHPEDRDRLAAGYAQTFGGGPSFELDYRLEVGGEVRTVHALGREDPDRPGIYAGTVQDVTDLRATEHALRRSQAALTRYAEELERSNRDLQDFGSVVAHDLRSPLRTVVGFAGILERRHGEDLPPAAREHLTRIVTGTDRMQELLDGLLAYSRAGEGGVRAAVDLRAVADEVVADLGAAIADAGGTVVVGALPEVVGDRTQLRQILLNLVGNALKFVDTEPPEVEIAAAREDGGWTVSVADRGIGVDPERAEHAFEVFGRLQPQEAYPGLGLGLAVTKKLVTRRGGRIRAEARAGGGTVVAFTVPDDLPDALVAPA